MYKNDFLQSRLQLLKETEEEINNYLEDNQTSKKEMEYLDSLFQSIYFRLSKIELFLKQNKNRF